ncbi:hypothetical protein OH77DRAFT_1499389 [Trametes cingulata]|nr:hypothetical protein OH77DRAFT_1499389 [Trametes cingulata]
MPALSLANGRWVGDVPKQLQGLTFAEELLIARFRRNYCVAHVKSGQGYLKANAIVFEQPVLKVYDVLPPPRSEIEDCFALLFTGPVKPSNDDYKRTPFIIRHRVVMEALGWLQLNHEQYAGVQISRENMAQFIDHEPPVCVVYRDHTGADGDEQNLAVYEVSDPRVGPSAESCPFVFHTLSAPELGRMSYSQRLAYAIRYFDQGGHALGVGHEHRPETMGERQQRASQASTE